jgi:NAD-dependent SIR2 family protein deacetylase
MSSIGKGPARLQLEGVNTLNDVVELINKSKRIIVVTGAGISVSTGIPDFRSKEGLYNTLDCAKFGIPSAELLFDIEFFQIDPAPFYQFAGSLLPDREMIPSVCHRFLAMLQARKKLMRNYTQNVDGLERRAGLTNVVECHGTMDRFHCTGPRCTRKQPLSALMGDVRLGKVCYCSCGEVMKPDVTFFGEQLPKVLFTTMAKDLPRCDLVLVIGTSLKVGGSVHEVLRGVHPSVPQVLINREVVALPSSMSAGFDVTILGQCDEIARYLCARLDWEGVEIPRVTPTLSSGEAGTGEHVEPPVVGVGAAASVAAIKFGEDEASVVVSATVAAHDAASGANAKGAASSKRKRLSHAEASKEAAATAERTKKRMSVWKCDQVCDRVWSVASS